MATPTKAPNSRDEQVLSKPGASVAKLPEVRERAGNTGSKVSIACNLPHGFTIHHKGHRLTLHGANHPKAIATGSTRSGLWGITPNVPEDWFDDWVAEHSVQAVRNGHIVKNSAAKIEAVVETMGDEVKTGADPVDPEAKDFKKKEGVESVPQDEDGEGDD